MTKKKTESESTYVFDTSALESAFDKDEKIEHQARIVSRNLN